MPSPSYGATPRSSSLRDVASRIGGVVAVLGVTACAAMGFPAAQREGGAAWLRTETAHCSLVSNMDPRDAERAAARLELWWVGMNRAMPVGTNGGEPQRVRAIAVRNDWQADAITDRFRGLFFGDSEIGTFVYVGDPGSAEGDQVAKHELAHAVIHARWPQLPQWLDEGMAAYLQSADFDEGSGLVTWGGRNLWETRLVMEYGPPVLASELIAPGRWRGSDVGVYTFRAGLLVHMLINRHRAELDCFIDALEQPTPDGPQSDPQPAINRCFPSRARWNFELPDYVLDRSHFPTQSARVERATPGVRTSPVGDAEAHALLALLDIVVADLIEPEFRPPRLARARRNVESALALDRGNALAVVLMNRLAVQARPR